MTKNLDDDYFQGITDLWTGLHRNKQGKWVWYDLDGSEFPVITIIFHTKFSYMYFSYNYFSLVQRKICTKNNCTKSIIRKVCCTKRDVRNLGMAS